PCLGKAAVCRPGSGCGARDRLLAAERILSAPGHLAESSDGVEKIMLTILCDPELHPAVHRRARELRTALEDVGIPAGPPQTAPVPTDRDGDCEIRIGLADEQLLRGQPRGKQTEEIAALRADGFA